MTTAAERAAAERKVQGLPETVSDPVALSKLATLIRTSNNNSDAAVALSPSPRVDRDSTSLVDGDSGAGRVQSGRPPASAASDEAQAGTDVASASTTPKKQKRPGNQSRAAS